MQGLAERDWRAAAAAAAGEGVFDYTCAAAVAEGPGWNHTQKRIGAQRRGASRRRRLAARMRTEVEKGERSPDDAHAQVRQAIFFSRFCLEELYLGLCSMSSWARLGSARWTC